MYSFTKPDININESLFPLPLLTVNQRASVRCLCCLWN